MSIHTSVMQADSPLNETPGAAAMADAERWHVRLRAADCTAAERMEFQRWRATSEHAAAYAKTERLWQSFGQLAGRPELEQLSRQVLADTTPQPSILSRRRLAIAASMLVCAISTGAFVALRDPRTPAVVYATQSGERSTIKLADGSQLILNSATEVSVRLSNDARTLVLGEGEAVFNVAHDPSRPFKVIAGDGEVTALGTRFQVRNEGERITITLLEGRVAVDRHTTRQRAQLKPGDQVRFIEGMPEMTRRTVDPGVVSSWTTGRLRFRSTPLAEALDEVNRYSATQIRIADPALANVPISGTFDIGDGMSVVTALEALFPIDATNEGDGEVQLTRR